MHYLKLFFLAFSLILSIVSAHEDDVNCIHDKVKQNFEFGEIEEAQPPTDEQGRVLQSTTYPNIRIYPYYDPLTVSAPASYKTYIERDLVPPVVDFFQAAIKVKYPVVGKLQVSTKVTGVCGMDTPSILFSGVDSDFFIIFDSTLDQSGSWVAISSFCYLSTTTKRPYIVTTKFNRALLVEANGDVLLHEKNTYLLMHEMIHNFGFSTSVYEYYLNETGQTRTGHIKTINLLGSTRTVLNVPSLTTRLRKFFGCSTLEGAYMENDGSAATAGSHFERRYFVYDTMTSGVIHGRRLSQFSLGMVEATGWYVVNYTYAEPYFFGQGQGCGFIRNACNSSTFNFDEYCKETNVRGCAPQGRGGGVCSADSKSDGCQYYTPLLDYDCENLNSTVFARLTELQAFGRGTGSRCFSGNLTSLKYISATPINFCFKFNCVGTGTNTTLEVLLGTTQKLICAKEGPLSVPGYNGHIDCPDPLTFCTTIGKKYCPRSCMGRGKCINNKCVCNQGFTGIDCGLLA